MWQIRFCGIFLLLAASFCHFFNQFMNSAVVVCLLSDDECFLAQFKDCIPLASEANQLTTNRTCYKTKIL